MQKPQIAVTIQINNGALFALIDIAETEDMSTAAVMSAILRSKLREFNHLPAVQGIPVFEEYIIKYPEERLNWQMLNHERERRTHLVDYTFNLNDGVVKSVQTWKRSLTFKRYNQCYLIARIIERFMHNMIERADREDVALEYMFCQWLDLQE